MATRNIDLATRWAKAVEQGRGLKLQAADLDLLVQIGAAELLMRAAAAELAEAVAKRRGAVTEPPPPKQAIGAADVERASARARRPRAR